MNADSPGSLDGLSILVVDDELDVRELHAYLLKVYGAQVHLAEGAGAALDILSEHTLHLIMSDIAMPGEDGYSLIRRVRALQQTEQRDIPAIAVTAFDRDVDRIRALAAGFNVHMTKPV